MRRSACREKLALLLPTQRLLVVGHVLGPSRLARSGVVGRGQAWSGVVGLGLGPGLAPGPRPGAMDLARSPSPSLAAAAHAARTLTKPAATPPCDGCEVSLTGL